MRAAHPLAGRGSIGVEELASVRLIMFDRTSSYYDLTNAFFRQAGIAPSGVMELDNIDAAKQMVGQGLGVALLPTTSVAAELADGRLQALQLDGVEPIRRRIVTIRRRDLGSPIGPTAAFLDVLDDEPLILPGRDGRPS